MQMSLRTDRTLLRSLARSTRYLMISMTAPTAPVRDGRSPIHVGIVLDRSGSMDGARKFELAAEAVAQSLRMLRPQDRFTLVVYDTAVDVLMRSSMATEDAKREAMQRLNAIRPRGGTDLYAGWMSGASQMLEYLSRESVNRVLLLTDGLANAGITAPSALVTAAHDLRVRGVSTTTFGVGDDFDERLLRDIAHESGGQFYFIETPRQIPDLLTSELGEALEVVHRDALLSVSLPAGAGWELLNRYRSTRSGLDNTLLVHLGDLTSAQALSVVVRLTFPQGREDAVTSVRVRLADSEREISWRYATHEANDSQPRDLVVDREVAALYAARARAAATEANRAGDFERARSVLGATASRIRKYSNGDEMLYRLSEDLLADVDTFSASPMSVMELKASFHQNEMRSRNRDPHGKARR